MLILTDEQKVQLSINPVTAAGNPAKVDDLPVWTSSDEDIITLEVSEDGMSAWAKTVGNLGSVQLTAKADADLGEGIREIVAVLDIKVKAAEAVALSILAGTPELK